MAAAKRKTTSKRTTKRAAKRNTKAKTVAKKAASKVARSATKQSGQSAKQWQKANEWAKQSAKLYQLPFNGDAAKAAAQQASEQVKSATETFVRAGNDIMSQMFGGTDPMAQWKGWMGQASGKLPSAEQTAEKMREFTRESAAQANKVAGDTTRALNEASELARENAEAMVEVGNIAIAVGKELGAELINYANRSFSQNVEMSKQLLGCRTLNDMFDLSSKVMKNNLDGFFSESVKLSEKLFQLSTDVSEPLNERISETSDRLTRVIAA